MLMRPPVFHGTEAEARDLAEAVGHNCGCPQLHQGGQPEAGLCSAHSMLVGTASTDQRVLDGLVYVRRALRSRLLEQEFGGQP